MKKLLLSFAAASSVIFSAGAQLDGDGYYRVQNHVTARYIYITDNKGKIDIPTTSVDALAIQLWKGDEKAASDPATVLHISKVDAGRYDYDVTAQGTGIYEIIGYYLYGLPSHFLENSQFSSEVKFENSFFDYLPGPVTLSK